MEFPTLIQPLLIRNSLEINEKFQCYVVPGIIDYALTDPQVKVYNLGDVELLLRADTLLAYADEVLSVGNSKGKYAYMQIANNSFEQEYTFTPEPELSNSTIQTFSNLNSSAPPPQVNLILPAPVSQNSAIIESILAEANLDKCDCSIEARDQLRELIIEYYDVFATPGNLGRCTTGQHIMDTGLQGPVTAKAYRLNPTERVEVERHITSMLESGVCEPSNSQWSSPCMLVGKKDGTTRFVIDYRALNKITRKDRYPLPKIDEILDMFSKGKYFSTLDLNSGFWQVEMFPPPQGKNCFYFTYGAFSI